MNFLRQRSIKWKKTDLKTNEKSAPLLGTDLTSTSIGWDDVDITITTNETSKQQQQHHDDIDTTSSASFEEHKNMKSPFIWKETIFQTYPNEFNKIFASKWLNDNEVLFGTKGNRLCIYDVNLNRCRELSRPNRTGQSTSTSQCGIHSIEYNKSLSIVATGGERPEDIVLMNPINYKFNDVILSGHKDWIYGMDFTDHNNLVSGGRDGTICIWNLNEVNSNEENNNINNKMMKPNHIGMGNKTMRSLQIDPHKMDSMITLTTTGEVSQWDLNRFTINNTYLINESRETVCLSINKSRNNCIAIGGKNNIYLIDSRSKISTSDRFNTNLCDGIKSIKSCDRGWGVRSIEWYRDNVISIGGGCGRLSFYDIRNEKYLTDSYPITSNFNSKSIRQLTRPFVSKGNDKKYIQVNRGWIREDNNYHRLNRRTNFTLPHCIYTHCFNSNGNKLFIGGGPTAFDFYGSLLSVYM